MVGNFYANIGKSKGIRDPVDRYETPDSVTRALARRVELPLCVREPACGTGRMARALAGLDHDVHATDIVEHGADFLEDDDPADCVVTNPPYRDRLAERFVAHALDVCDGPVAMLLRLGFLTSQGRHRRLLGARPPARLIVISRRILFFKADGSRISGQAHDHAWMVWNVPVGRRAVDVVGPDELPDVGRE